MRMILTAIMVAAVSLPAYSINRYDTKSLSCQEVQSIVKRDGAAILRYPSARGTGTILYDRYVATGLQCEYNKHPVYRTVPARDNASCAVTSCRSGGDPGS